MPSNEDLWTEIDLSSGENFPVDLLKSQAALLKDKTNGILSAIVETTTDEEVIYHTLYIIAPKMGNYRYALLKTASTSKPYPVFIYDNSKDDEAIAIKHPRKIVKNPFALNTGILQLIEATQFFQSTGKVEYVGKAIPEPDINATNYTEFEQGIKSILSSKETSAVIHSLLAQSEQNA